MNDDSIPWQEVFGVKDEDLPGICLSGARYRECMTQEQLSKATATPWRVAKAEALPGYRVKVRFQDGLEGVVDMAGLIRSPRAGVFADLQNAERFQSLFVELGVVTWPDGQDLAPDAMHAAIKQHGQWVLS